MSRTILKLAAGAGAVVLAAGTGAAGHALVDNEPEQLAVPVTSGLPAARSSGLTVGQIYRRVRTGVVEITVTSSAASTDPFGQQQGGRQQAQGSGFVLDEQGHVVTNHHVVDGAETASVTFSNGESYDATVVGTDPSTDLAVLKVDAPSSLLTPL
ncbi:MAG: trypsin-like peptidase domain-containing protein, partial [Actinobacteria bacterium]|nr:trypsin-like peptidase domain-containing protein [Actinomycetota bacterium]